MKHIITFVAITLVCISQITASASSYTSYTSSKSSSSGIGGSQSPSHSNLSNEVSSIPSREPIRTSVADHTAAPSSRPARLAYAVSFPSGASIKQDQTGFGMINRTSLRKVSPYLSGEFLVEAYSDFFAAHEAYLKRIVELRLTAIQQADPILEAMIERFNRCRDTDFTYFVNDPHHPFFNYASSLKALARQNAIMHVLHDRASTIASKFEFNEHLDNEENTVILRAIKAHAAQYAQDLNEMSHWTNPCSLSQITELINLYPNEAPKQQLLQLQRKAEAIGRRLD